MTDIKNCPDCGGTHYAAMTGKCPLRDKCCSVCSEDADLACSDCAIASGGEKTVYVCKKARCRDLHEEQHHQLLPDVLSGMDTAPGITDEEMLAIIEQAYKDGGSTVPFEKHLKYERPWIDICLAAMRAVASRTRQQRSEVTDEPTLKAWIDDLSRDANRGDRGDGWAITDIGRRARTLAKQRLSVLLELRTRPATPAPDALLQDVLLAIKRREAYAGELSYLERQLNEILIRTPVPARSPGS